VFRYRLDASLRLSEVDLSLLFVKLGNFRYQNCQVALEIFRC